MFDPNSDAPWLDRQDPYSPDPGLLTGTGLTDPTAAPPPPASTQPVDSQPVGTQPAAGSSPWTDPGMSPTQAPGDYTSDLGAPKATTGPVASQPGPGGSTTPASAYQSAQTYADLLKQIQAATDPTSAATARDTLARTLQSDLEADGHRVSWKGEQIIVDGRAYDVGAFGDTTPTATSGPVESQPGPGGSTGTSAPGPTAGGQGFDDPNAYGQAWIKSGGRTLQDWQAFVAAHPLPAGWRVTGTKGDKVTGPNGQTFDAVISAGTGGTGAQWQDTALGAGGASGAPGADASGLLTFGNNLADLPPWLTADSADPELMKLAGTLPGFSDVYDRLAQADPTEGATQGLVSQILAHPESLSEQDIETLKAKTAEETALAGQAQDEELQHFGANANLQDSPWLAASRAENAWNRRSATIGTNRNIDIAAASQRESDRRAAASLGQSYGAYRTGKAQTAITTAVETGLAKGNLEQAAKTLGMSKSALLVNYIGQHVGAGIDMAKVKQAGEQFQQELAYRISALKQADDQFQANFQLALNRFNLERDQDYWQRAQATYNPPAT